MMTVYDYLPSQNAYKVRLLLSHLNQAYASKIISIFEGEGRSDAYRRVSPTGTVPALELEDGRCLAESNAILMYLAEGSDYLPDEPFAKAKVLQWLFFEGETVQAGIATLRHWVQTGKDKNRSDEVLESKRALSIKALEILDRELENNRFLGGDRYTIADMAVFSYVHLAHEADLPLHDFVHVARWIDDVRAQDGFLPQVHPYSIDPFSAREL